GLMAAGADVNAIGLALTPMAYFAQFDLDVPCVAMVTASHNDNGWTGVKMGAARPLTFGPDEMSHLKAIVLEARFKPRGGGAYAFIENFPARSIAASRSFPPAPPAPPGHSRRGFSPPSAAKSSRSIASSTTPSPNTTPTPKT